MGTFEIVSAIFLILSCIFIIIVVFFQGSQQAGMSQSITGQSSDNYYQRNMGRSREMRLKKLTTVAAVLFFVVAMAVNVIAAHFSDETVGEGPTDSMWQDMATFGTDNETDVTGATDGTDPVSPTDSTDTATEPTEPTEPITED